MRLADFITKNIEAILMEWEAFARGIWPGAAATDPATLRDHAEKMLHAIVSDMQSSQSDEQRSEKSRGGGGDGPDAARVNRVSAAHGMDRVGSGFDLAAVIAEYRALRASVIRLWRESRSSTHLSDLSDITRFNESIDQSLTQAVVAYSQQVERDRAVALEQQKETSRELRQLNDQLLVSSVRQHELTAQANQATVAVRAAKEEAESANRTKDRFLAVLSHELRTPLTPVVMTISAIEIDSDLPFKFREDLVMVRRNIDLEVKLIDDLLDLSRITTGKLRLHVQPVRVHELLSHVVRSSFSETSTKRLRVRQELDAGNDYVEADSARLQQVFWNLLRNAVKFTPEGGDISVRTWNGEGNGHLYVEVRDTGVGIDCGVLPRVFDAFQQGETGMARQFGGLGLGLAIAKAVTEMHGGTITAASEGRDHGAVFTLALRTEPAVSLQESRGTPSETSSEKCRICPRVLLVEDHPDTARVLAKLLRDSGYDVTTAGNAASALQLAASQPFDIVISDIGLPDATGYELMKQIFDRHGLKGIALSGYGMEDDMRKSSEAGFIEHLVKPVNLAQLRAVITRVISSDGTGR